jgi:hypothetical protein
MQKAGRGPFRHNECLEAPDELCNSDACRALGVAGSAGQTRHDAGVCLFREGAVEVFYNVDAAAGPEVTNSQGSVSWACIFAETAKLTLRSFGDEIFDRLGRELPDHVNTSAM